MKIQVIIVAGGKGSRVSASVPKQFLSLAGEPILFHTLKVFHHYHTDIEPILVLPENHIPYWEKIIRDKNFTIPHQVVIGGPSRFHSVKNGLKYTEKNGIIAIHDGVRPFITTSFLEKIFNRTIQKGSCIPVFSVDQSLRYVEGDVHHGVERQFYYFVQTPQCFKAGILHSAYQQAYHPSFTDDASVVEASGEPIHLIQGLENNIKITRKKDLVFAESLLKDRL